MIIAFILHHEIRKTVHSYPLHIHIFYLQLTFKHIWTNHLSINNRGRALVETKTSNDNNNKNITTTMTSNVCVLCSPTTIFVWFCFSVRCVRCWNCPKFMHKFKYTSMLVLHPQDSSICTTSPYIFTVAIWRVAFEKPSESPKQMGLLWTPLDE